MNDSRKRKSNGSEDKVPFRSNRIHNINGQWYFLTREGQNIGPFATKDDAEAGLARFMKIVKKDA